MLIFYCKNFFNPIPSGIVQKNICETFFNNQYGEDLPKIMCMQFKKDTNIYSI